MVTYLIERNKGCAADLPRLCFFFVVQYSTRPVFAFIKYIKQYFFRKLLKTKSFVTQIVSYLYFCSLIIILIEYYVDN